MKRSMSQTCTRKLRLSPETLKKLVTLDKHELRRVAGGLPFESQELLTFCMEEMPG